MKSIVNWIKFGCMYCRGEIIPSSLRYIPQTAIRINIVAVVLLVPAILWVVPVYGAIGAAWVWVTLNAGYCVIGVHFMYRRILSTEKWAWYFTDILIPLTAAIAAALLCRWVVPVQFDRIVELVVVLGCSLTVLTAASMSAPLIRRQLVGHVLR